MYLLSKIIGFLEIVKIIEQISQQFDQICSAHVKKQTSVLTVWRMQEYKLQRKEVILLVDAIGSRSVGNLC